MKPAHKEVFSDGSIVRILTFDVRVPNQELLVLGINIQKIKEILDAREAKIQPLSENYYPLIGMINLRHRSIPLLDLGHFFSGSKLNLEDLSTQKRRIIICEFQKIQLGILVETTHKIRQFPNSSIQPVPSVLSTFPSNIFNGMLEDQGNFINLLDIEFILTKLNVDVAPEKQTGSSTLDLKGKRILIVEDSKLFQKKLLHFFEGLGAELHLSEDGEDGLRKVRELGNKLDLIFTDIEMPKLNGIGMVKQLRADSSWKPIPVIFNTSISNPGLIADIEAEKLGHYIVKFDEAEIFRVLKEIF